MLTDDKADINPIGADNMKPFTLKKAAKAVGGTASGEAKLCGVSIDSRTVKDGELYVALIGENFDGHSSQ